jgi:hypothetical protein
MAGDAKTCFSDVFLPRTEPTWVGRCGAESGIPEATASGHRAKKGHFALPRPALTGIWCRFAPCLAVIFSTPRPWPWQTVFQQLLRSTQAPAGLKYSLTPTHHSGDGFVVHKCCFKSTIGPKVGKNTSEKAPSCVWSSGHRINVRYVLCPWPLMSANNLWLDRATIRFRFFGHAATYTGSFCVFGPALSSPAHGVISLAMEQIENEIF